MLIRIIRWSLGIPLGIAAYIYDDALWGPVPIAAMNGYFGWPYGFILLCIIYFFLSFGASLLILRHYDANQKQRKTRGLKKKLTTGKKAYAYKLLIAGKWAGLAVSCFTLGAVLTSIVVGRLQLFKEVSRPILALIMSGLFVFLFMGFYGGVFAFVISQGVTTTLIVALICALVIKLWQLNHRHHAVTHAQH